MDDDLVSDELKQQFYAAAQAMQGSGSPELDVLLQKGLYGQKMPSELRGKKAAEAFQRAFDLIGGIPRLAVWADKNPNAFYSLYSKLIPSSVKTELNATIKIDAPWMNPQRLSYRDALTAPPQAIAPPQDVVDVTPKPSKPSTKRVAQTVPLKPPTKKATK